MIRIIRIRFIDEKRPAGEYFDFNSWPDNELLNARNASNWLWGKSADDYLIVKDGHPIELESNEVAAIEKQLAED